MSPLEVPGGRWSVVVLGPGEVGEQLSSEPRANLVAWGRANRGTDASRLERDVPRLPLVIATQISEHASERLASTLSALGLEVERRAGGALSYPAVRRKMWTLAARRTWLMFLSLALGFDFFHGTGCSRSA